MTWAGRQAIRRYSTPFPLLCKMSINSIPKLDGAGRAYYPHHSIHSVCVCVKSKQTNHQNKITKRIITQEISRLAARRNDGTIHTIPVTHTRDGNAQYRFPVCSVSSGGQADPKTDQGGWYLSLLLSIGFSLDTLPLSAFWATSRSETPWVPFILRQTYVPPSRLAWYYCC